MEVVPKEKVLMNFALIMLNGMLCKTLICCVRPHTHNVNECLNRNVDIYFHSYYMNQFN